MDSSDQGKGGYILSRDEGTQPINVRVRPDRGNKGDVTVRVTGVSRDKDSDSEGPWGAKGPLWFFARLLVFIMCVTIISTRGWAIGGTYDVGVVAKVQGIGNISEIAYLDYSEIGIVTACFKGSSASAILGPYDGEQCEYVWSFWSEDPWLASFIFSVLFVVGLSIRLSIEAAELLNPGFLPVAFQHPTLVAFLRHWCWIMMLLTWACFLGGWDNKGFDAIRMDYKEVSQLGWGFITWVSLWCLWMIKVILIACRQI
eukprot:TRINITY_DN18667_c0_g1_i1.p1 TRINITY_DN18667_c0_g1~~TRINITY_DN18667_c0_g1_i1.p1  ORF type:complete len:274 (+),score=47.46 TRINITY_DN18667_c0_g1_i1:52-822(+)